jgi:predicted kinase
MKPSSIIGRGSFAHKPLVIIVFGPPGSGKTTYVNKHRGKGDIVWDSDTIMQAIAGTQDCGAAVPFVLAMRRAFYAKAIDSRGLAIDRIWIIEATRRPRSMVPEIEQLQASTVILNTSKEVCLERVRDRGAHWARIVAEWFEGEPADSR